MAVSFRSANLHTNTYMALICHAIYVLMYKFRDLENTTIQVLV
jgi:hypothetical protein